MKRLLVQLSELGVKLQLDGGDLRVTAPQGVLTAELRQALREHKASLVEGLRAKVAIDEPPVIEPDPAHAHEPFPLTELQHAYWMGRMGRIGGLALGQVATHLYMEYDSPGLDVPRLQAALNRLIQRHGTLRTIVDGDGQQRVLLEVPPYRITVADLSDAPPDIAQRAVDAVRAELSHQVFPADRSPLFDIRITRLPTLRQRLHLSLDLLILDNHSIHLFLREWMRLYANPALAIAPIGIAYRDCVLAERRWRESAAYQRAHAYWMAKVDALPAAPQLPLRWSAAPADSGRFVRRGGRLDAARWQRLKAAARSHGLTPSGLVMALYAEVLARWSASPQFTINLTLDNRPPLHADVPQVLGNFSSLLLQEVDRSDSRQPLLAFAQGLQKRFLANYEHRQVCGVSVMREWSKRRRNPAGAAMPVVFTSALAGEDEGQGEQVFGPRIHTESQTSQVWLDHVALEEGGSLCFEWYSADAVFEPAVVDAMFDVYRGLIERLGDDPSLLHGHDLLPLPQAMQRRRDLVARTAGDLPQRPLHAAFVEQARQRPDAIALVAPGRSMTRGQLLAESAAVAEWLQQAGVQPGRPVAVAGRKGWEQVVAAIGVLLAGAAYLPVDADLPPRRQLELLRIGEVRHVLAQAGALDDVAHQGDWAVHEIRAGQAGQAGGSAATGFSAALERSLERSLQQPLEQLAYVIFTSGTTGVPKGVMIDHRGAANTVMHINRMVNAGADSRVLAVSSLSFDLSVYDIFGVLGAGGSLVLPDPAKGHDAQHWRELVVQHGVTLWNSAPQLMQMLMDSFGAGDATPLAALRHVLLSGDFIPLALPQRIKDRAAQASVIALGGATEASIWSNFHVVDGVQPGWASIPYGRALPNQTMAVHDHAMRLCPDQVKGRIFIGGIGLAMGYWQDAAKTDERFVRHPQTGERLYHTGDIGRYAADGDIIIIGREDSQVKIRGHRVELGEIEAALRAHPSIKQAVASVTGAPPELVAHIELAFGAPEPTAAAVQDHLREHLPGHMLPQHLLFVPRLPVSANGKVDRQALPALTQHAAAPRALVAPRSDIERRIVEVWSRIFIGVDIGVTDDFFELGGDSLLLTQLLRELNEAMPFPVDVGQLYRSQTPEMLARLYASLAPDATHESPQSAPGMAEQAPHGAPIELLA
jgi:pyochelin synthetase